MTEGKLVRDLIPALIRESGKDAQVRYLSGSDLMGALAAKLEEEASEAALAIDSREALVEELADLYEVMSGLIALRGIRWREVVEAADAKAKRRGRFESGAWLTVSE